MNQLSVRREITVAVLQDILRRGGKLPAREVLARYEQDIRRDRRQMFTVQEMCAFMKKHVPGVRSECLPLSEGGVKPLFGGPIKVYWIE